jgi:three-Cys-motif partner protein
MNRKGIQGFGGNWTEEKLERVKKYLTAYAKIMSKQKFRYAYVDAFAGTGYREQKEAEKDKNSSFLVSGLEEDEPQGFLDGSASIALQVEPRFSRYIFIEKHAQRFQELEKVKASFPDRASDIFLVNADANSYLGEFCNKNWKQHRAVVFLDPFGMQVTWETIKAIAKTKAIDLWILFPLGAGVSRLLRRDGKIEPALRTRLDQLFGAKDWFDAFYQERTEKLSSASIPSWRKSPISIR